MHINRVSVYKLKYAFLLFLIFMFFLVSFLPQLRILNVSIYFSFFISLIIAFLTSYEVKFKRKNNILFFSAFLVFFSYALVISLVADRVVFNRYLSYAHWMVVFLISYHVLRSKRLSAVALMYLMFPFVLYVAVKTFIFLGITENAIRGNRPSGELYYLSSLGGGGYDFLYFLVFYNFCLFVYLMSDAKKSLIEYFLLIPAVVFFVSIVFLSNFATAVIITIFFGASYFFSGFKFYIWVLIFPFLYVCFYFILDGVIQFLGGHRVSENLIDFKSLLYEFKVEGAASSRFDVYAKSINGFFESPVFGKILESVLFF